MSAKNVLSQLEIIPTGYKTGAEVKGVDLTKSLSKKNKKYCAKPGLTTKFYSFGIKF